MGPFLAGVSPDVPRLILELGAVVLLGAALGWLARRVALPSLAGFLAAGLVVAVLAPWLSVDRGQLQLLANLGVVARLQHSCHAAPSPSTPREGR